jgi:hypothetical protein
MASLAPTKRSYYHLRVLATASPPAIRATLMLTSATVPQCPTSRVRYACPKDGSQRSGSSLESIYKLCDTLYRTEEDFGGEAARWRVW